MAQSIGYGILWLILVAIKYTPKWLISGFANALAACLVLIPKERRRIGANVQRIYGLPTHSEFSRLFCRQVIRHQTAAMLETFRELLRPGSITILGFSEYQLHLEKARGQRGQKQGVIIITAHIGSWELVSHFGAKAINGDFYALAKPPTSLALQKILQKIRTLGGTKVLWTGQGSILKSMLVTLKAGHPLGFVMDQKPDQRVGPEVDFLGQQTVFVAGPAKIACRTQAPILAVFCLRMAPWCYKITVKRLECTATDDDAVLTQMFASEIAHVIHTYPEQWLWNYKRW